MPKIKVLKIMILTLFLGYIGFINLFPTELEKRFNQDPDNAYVLINRKLVLKEKFFETKLTRELDYNCPQSVQICGKEFFKTAQKGLNFLPTHESQALELAKELTKKCQYHQGIGELIIGESFNHFDTILSGVCADKVVIKDPFVEHQVNEELVNLHHQDEVMASMRSKIKNLCLNQRKDQIKSSEQSLKIEFRATMKLVPLVAKFKCDPSDTFYWISEESAKGYRWDESNQLEGSIESHLVLVDNSLLHADETITSKLEKESVPLN